jgi:ATP-dependent RNA helicase DHX37/DHR1
MLMSQFPVSPRYAKMLIVAAQQSETMLKYVICVVSGLSVGDPFLRDSDLFFDFQIEDDEEENNEVTGHLQQKRRKFFKVLQVYNFLLVDVFRS